MVRLAGEGPLSDADRSTERGGTEGARAKKGTAGNKAASDSEALPTPVFGVQALFEAFLVLWVVATWVVFTYVGEKMAWHVVYFATSLSFLGGLWFGRLYDGIDWRDGAQERRVLADGS